MFFNRRSSTSQGGDEASSNPPPTIRGPIRSLDALGLSHLDPVQRAGLRDDVLSGFFQNDTSEVFTGVPLGPEDILVDVGFGSGGPLQFCSRFAGQIFALDLSINALKFAEKNALIAKTENISFIRASAEEIPLEHAMATRVVCLEVLEHVQDPHKVMAELVRIGQPGCIYLISVPGQSSEELMRQIAPPEMYEVPHHIRIFSEAIFRELVLDSGLQIVSESKSGSFSTFFVSLYWQKFGVKPGQAFEAIDHQLSHQDPLLNDWAKAWNFLLDLPSGPHIKNLFDQFLPKSQIIVARKPHDE